jgi:drug/metabolite transporter (DMT)-like permease
MGSEPVFGAIFAALLMGEALTGSGWVGALLIIVATTFVLKRN